MISIDSRLIFLNWWNYLLIDVAHVYRQLAMILEPALQAASGMKNITLLTLLSLYIIVEYPRATIVL